jgi:hypothetical protein
MDGQRFDDLTRALVAMETSRRQVLKRLAGMVGGGVAAGAPGRHGTTARDLADNGVKRRAVWTRTALTP